MKLVDVRPLSYSGNLVFGWRYEEVNSWFVFGCERFPVFNTFINPNKIYTLEDLYLSIGLYRSDVIGSSYAEALNVSPNLMIGTTNVLKPSELLNNAYSSYCNLIGNTIIDDFIIADKAELVPQGGEDQEVKIKPKSGDYVDLYYKLHPKLYSDRIAILPLLTEYERKLYTGGVWTEKINLISYSSPQLNKIYIKSQNYNYLQFVFGIQTNNNFEGSKFSIKFDFSLNANLLEYIP